MIIRMPNPVQLPFTGAPELWWPLKFGPSPIKKAPSGAWFTRETHLSPRLGSVKHLECKAGAAGAKVTDPVAATAFPFWDLLGFFFEVFLVFLFGIACSLS
jgi:hypothetical protein